MQRAKHNCQGINSQFVCLRTVCSLGLCCPEPWACTFQNLLGVSCVSPPTCPSSVRIIFHKLFDHITPLCFSLLASLLLKARHRALLPGPFSQPLAAGSLLPCLCSSLSRNLLRARHLAGCCPHSTWPGNLQVGSGSLSCCLYPATLLGGFTLQVNWWRVISNCCHAMGTRSSRTL